MLVSLFIFSGDIGFKCRKCVILHIIDAQNVQGITFSALKAD